MIGTKLLHYEITEKLGEGGMGVVYKARDTHLDRFVAIKVLPAERVADASRKARFVQEAKAASALNHPNIVVVHDISTDSGVDFIAMEYVAGKTLDQLIPRKGMRLNEALKIAVQIADALARAHAAGIIHRDLKPANIMVDAHGQVKVLDFGLAKLTEQGTTSEDAATETIGVKTDEGSIVGTAAYMSPEQAEGKPFDARSDIFSFGAVLYEMVTGQRAFQGDSKMSTLSAVLHKEPHAMPEETPYELRKIVARCLRKDPDRRVQHMSDLRVALLDLKDESESGAGAAGPPGTVRAPRRRVWLWAGLLVLLVAGGTALWQWSRKPAAGSLPVLAPLTAYPGQEGSPSFSPDSRQVTFTWDGAEAGVPDLYVKLLTSPNHLRLTTGKNVHSAAWSPNGDTIAYVRGEKDKAVVCVIPAIGGPEKVVREIDPGARVSGSAWPSVAWTPDGKWLLSADGVMVAAGSGETRQMWPPGSARRSSPVFSWNGSALAFSEFADTGNMRSDIFVQDLGQDYQPMGAPRRLTNLNQLCVSPAWTQDNRKILFVAVMAWVTPGALYQVAANGSGPPELLSLTTVSVQRVAAAPHPGRFALLQLQRDYTIRRVALTGPGQAASESSEFIASTRMDYLPVYSPDGSQVAFVSDRNGSMGIWKANADGSSPVELFSRPGTHVDAPAWSPDGARIAFCFAEASGRDIWLVPAQGGSPQRLTGDSTDDFAPSWSADGKWVYFSAMKAGAPPEVWKIPAAGGAAARVMEDPGYALREIPDGRVLYFERQATASPLRLAPSPGARGNRILPEVFGYAFHPSRNGIYFMARPEPGSPYFIRFYNFRNGAVTNVLNLGRQPGWGLTVSPDEKTLLFTVDNGRGADLMLVENFR